MRSRLHRARKLGRGERVLVDKVADTQCSGYTADYTRCYLPAGAAASGRAARRDRAGALCRRPARDAAGDRRRPQPCSRRRRRGRWLIQAPASTVMRASEPQRGGRGPRRVGAVRARAPHPAGRRDRARARPVRGAGRRRRGRGRAAGAAGRRGGADHRARRRRARPRSARACTSSACEVRPARAADPTAVTFVDDTGERTITTFGPRLEPRRSTRSCPGMSWRRWTPSISRPATSARCAPRARRGCSWPARARSTRSGTASRWTRWC